MAKDNDTDEILHYANSTDFKLSNLASPGLYLFSVRLYKEFGMDLAEETGTDVEDEESTPT